MADAAHVRTVDVMGISIYGSFDNLVIERGWWLTRSRRLVPLDLIEHVSARPGAVVIAMVGGGEIVVPLRDAEVVAADLTRRGVGNIGGGRRQPVLARGDAA